MGEIQLVVTVSRGTSPLPLQRKGGGGLNAIWPLCFLPPTHMPPCPQQSNPVALPPAAPLDTHTQTHTHLHTHKPIGRPKLQRCPSHGSCGWCGRWPRLTGQHGKGGHTHSHKCTNIPTTVRGAGGEKMAISRGRGATARPRLPPGLVLAGQEQGEDVGA